MNIFRASKGENRIFRDERSLFPDFLPEQLPGREREIREMVYCLSPAAEGKQPEHALLYGPPGTGKTSCSRIVLKQLSEYSQRPLPVYINCWESQSRFAILGFLAAALGEPMPRRGIAADEVLSRVVEIAKKESRVIVAVLDEVDRLGTQEEGALVLYDLCRASETHSLPVGVIAITNDSEFHLRLDPRVRSSFVQHALKFDAYSVFQLKEILGQRAGRAFFPDSLDSEVVPLCAAMAHKAGGDARVALSLLLFAGKAAERENAARVEVRHVRQAEGQALIGAAVKAERKLPDMDGADRQIVEEVKKAGKKGVESGRLYDALSRVAGERALRARVDRLVRSGILAAGEVQLGAGRSRVIRIKE